MSQETPPNLENPFVQKLHFRNFKALAEVDISIRSRLAVIVGPNSIGKSSVLEGAGKLSLAVSQRPMTQSLARAIGLDSTSFDQLTTKGGTSSARRVVIGATTSAGRADLTVESESGAQPVGTLSSPDLGWRLSVQDPQRASLSNSPIAPLGESAFFRLEASTAAEPSELATTPLLHRSGKGLPGVLSWLASNTPEARTAIEDDLRYVVPGTRRIYMPTRTVIRTENLMVEQAGKLRERKVKREVSLIGLQIEFEGRGRIDSDMVSEGTILALTLLTVLHRPVATHLILLDDLDRGLHPGAQARLIELLIRILQLRPTLQIIATTHSPYLVDQVPPEGVIVMAADSKGAASSRLLIEHPDYGKWRNTLRPGELWPYFGESWVTEGGGRSA